MRKPLTIALLAMLLVQGWSESAPGQDLLEPRRLYAGINQEIPVVLSMRGRTKVPEKGFTLLLLDGNGQVLDSAEGLNPGAMDLGNTLPEIWTLSQVGRVQVVADGVAIGSPLVVQPMLTPVLVRSVRDVRPDGKTRYTRVIGFGDELLDPENEEDRRALDAQAESPDWDPGEPVVNTGVRVYPDRDVLLQTGFGPIRIALAPEFAPNTAWNFRQLAEGGFYDNTTVHRVVHFDRNGNRFVIQGGDPSGTGNGSAGWNLPMERSALPHDLGVISMARADHPDSAGSQWFICLSRQGTARLDGQYIAFGWATDGAETISSIADVEITDVAAGRPVDPPEVFSASLIPAAPQVPGTGRIQSRIQQWWTPPPVESTGRKPR
ncbi:MAG: peptidylprolyl isomerase [Phycisphaerales bacterium]|nr:peptidylprolyl isomerase [Phycisphaerales bacterium]